MFIRLDNSGVIDKIYESKILKYILIDYEKYEYNSTILILINKCVKEVLARKDKLAIKLINDVELLEFFSAMLRTQDYQYASQPNRKAIYPFIHSITSYVMEGILSNVKEEDMEFASIFQTNMDWVFLVSKFADSEKVFKIEWG